MSKLSYVQLINKLKQLIKQRASGTVYIKTDRGHALRFDLDRGQISYISYKGRQGNKALSEIDKIQSGSFKFEPDSLPLKDKSLPDTDAILDQIYPRQESAFAQKTLDGWQELLTEYIGPVAELIFKDQIESLGLPQNEEQAKYLLESLADEIEDPEQKQAFIRRGMNLI